MANLSRPPRQRGTSLLEVMITLVLVAFGLLGIAAFQAKAQVGSIEAYQRAQAVLLLEDMQSRISGNSAQAEAYVTASPVGTDDSQPADCSSAFQALPRPVQPADAITALTQNTARIDAPVCCLSGQARHR